MNRLRARTGIVAAVLFPALLAGTGAGAQESPPPAAQSIADSIRQVTPALVFDSARPDPLAAPSGSASLPSQDEAVDRDGDGIPTLVDICPDSPPGSRVDELGCPPAPVPWWVWTGGGLGLLAVVRIGWIPYARRQRRKQLREARIAQGDMGVGGPFQAPGAPVPWSAPQPQPAPQAWQPPDLEGPAQARPPAPEPPFTEIAPPAGAAPPASTPPAPQPGVGKVGFPAPPTPPRQEPPGPTHPSHSDLGFPSERAARTPAERAVPAQSASEPADGPMFSTSPANPAGQHHWQDQPLHYEKAERPTGVGWVSRYPLASVGLALLVGIAGTAWFVQSRGGPLPGPSQGMVPVTIPTVVALAPDSSDGSVTTSRIPAALRMVDGDGQVGRVGQILPIPVSVQVEDADGLPIPGVPVLFEATVGGGVVSPLATQTDSSGIARSFWTLGAQVIKQYAVARVAGSEAGVAFEADAGPGLASRIVAVRGDGQEAPPGQMLTDPVVVRVESAEGDPLEGIRIAFNTDGGGSANPVEGVSDTLGQVSTVWTLGAVGDSTVLRAEVAEAPGIAAQITARLSYPSLPAQAGVVAGGTHSCALSVNGNLVCWGGNQSGQLGTGGGRAPSPQSVAPGRRFSEVSAGLAYTCGVESSGIAYCWGDNANAQLGDGSRAPQTTPTPVAAEVRFRTVSAGNGHTCGISREGAVYCWGSNSYGQLGDGTRSDRDRPVRTSGASNFQSLAVGWFHTCALTPDGRASCWGRNAFGQLGDGTTDDHLDPSPVGGAARYTALSAGGAHTCGLATDRAVYCWGQNNYGQLGQGGNDPRTRPTPVTGGPWRSVTAGGVHSCALDASGSAFCWGRNTYGQVGDGSTTDRSSPTPVDGGLVFATIRASGAHTCGTTTAGDQYCWGYNVEGQLGDGSRENRSVPTRVGSE